MYNDLGQAQAAQQELANELPRARSADEIQVTVPHLSQLARALAAQGNEADTMTIIQEFLTLIDRIAYALAFNTMPLLFAYQWLADRSNEAVRACLQRLERVDKQFSRPGTVIALSEARGHIALAQKEMATKIPELKGLTYQRLDRMGAPLQESKKMPATAGV